MAACVIIYCSVCRQCVTTSVMSLHQVRYTVQKAHAMSYSCWHKSLLITGPKQVTIAFFLLGENVEKYVGRGPSL